MKKVLILGAVVGVILSMGAIAYANSFSTPAEIYANLAGISTEEAYDLREAEDKSYGQLADEAGFLEEFQEATLEMKKEIIADRVERGLLTQEEADELLKIIEENECDGTGEKHLGQEYGIGFGRGLNSKGQGLGRGNGRMLRDGSGQGCGAGRGNGCRF